MTVEPLCGAHFRALFRNVRCRRPQGHPGPCAVVIDGKVVRNRETPGELRERLLREEGVAVP